MSQYSDKHVLATKPNPGTLIETVRIDRQQPKLMLALIY